METYRFEIDGEWKGGRLGQGNVKTNGLETIVSVPKEMGGPGQGTNPEELLISAASNCYMITLAAVLEKRELPIQQFSLQTEGIVIRNGGRLQFEKITHRPHIILEGASEEQIKAVEAAAIRAEQACFISQTLKGNVEVEVEPQIQMR